MKKRETKRGRRKEKETCEGPTTRLCPNPHIYILARRRHLHARTNTDEHARLIYSTALFSTASRHGSLFLATIVPKILRIVCPSHIRIALPGQQITWNNLKVSVKRYQPREEYLELRRKVAVRSRSSGCFLSACIAVEDSKLRRTFLIKGSTFPRRISALLILLALSVQSAPVMNSPNKTDDMKWVNPCGVSTKLRTNGSNPDIAQLEDHDLLNQIVLQARTALKHAQLFRDEFIRQTFKTDFGSVHNLWRKNHYAWLPTRSEIPKELGEELDKKHLEKLEINTSLVDAYEYMQKYAVGLEQVVLDQKDYQPKYHQKFTEAEWKLRAVLCEIQVALEERSVTRRPDVTRDVMTSDFRTMTDMTFRDLRDWLIFREYMNGLEYVIQRQKISSQKLFCKF
ncbi:Uncharacterized protein DBV15_07778 [Temnothorax longispinosus]|uniref:Uncharacterized protein n=1 Tax=Temnothorax longispinosus TaxID=300112 RepID=A0A4S2KNY4_9HYME|nr:Uncharacterized protein DBV15_07778 [Temnothorax longispinosus]